MDEINTDASPKAMLECMMLIRAFEENNKALNAAGNFPGTCTCIGQEASAVGVVRALTKNDLILTNHRSAGHLIARGADPGRILAEIMGRSAIAIGFRSFQFAKSRLWRIRCMMHVCSVVCG